MMGSIRRKLDQAAVRRFYEQNPAWPRPRLTQQEIASAFAEHPVWQRVSEDLRRELSVRLASANDHFESFDADHAFEVVAAITDLCDVLHQNILPIDGDRHQVSADKCWLIAETFRKLGSKGLGEVIEAQATNIIDDQAAVEGLTNSTMCLEAAVCVDHYRLDAMPLMALAWVYRNQDFLKADRIIAEAERLIPILPKQRFHSVSVLDRAAISLAGEIVDSIKMVRQQIDQLRSVVAYRNIQEKVSG